MKSYENLLLVLTVSIASISHVRGMDHSQVIDNDEVNHTVSEHQQRVSALTTQSAVALPSKYKLGKTTNKYLTLEMFRYAGVEDNISLLYSSNQVTRSFFFGKGENMKILLNFFTQEAKPLRDLKMNMERLHRSGYSLMIGMPQEEMHSLCESILSLLGTRGGFFYSTNRHCHWEGSG